MNSLSQLRKLLAALVLAGMAALMLACSSSDEDESSDTSGGDSGVPCDIDPGQPHCLEELQNK